MQIPWRRSELDNLKPRVCREDAWWVVHRGPYRTGFFGTWEHAMTLATIRQRTEQTRE